MPVKPYYEAGGITLYHGDCREVLPELESESFDLVLTDPPYLVSYSGRWGSDSGIIEGDSDPSWIVPAFAEAWRILKQDSLCISFYGWPHADVFLSTWKHIGFRPVSVLVFVKDRWGFGRFTRAQHEQAYILAKGHPEKPDKAISDVLAWEEPNPRLHPNQKPLGAISKLIATYGRGECHVLDPFCGSGTTLVAAQRLGCKAVGIEVNEGHCEAAALRLSQSVMDFQRTDRTAEQMLLLGDTSLP